MNSGFTLFLGKRISCIALLLALGCFRVESAHAQEGAPPLPRIALTAPPENDPEYELMGEFVGPITIGDNQYEPLGLQIRPIGADQFEALQYKGGLPGQQTFVGEEPIKLVGRRSDDFVVLSGGPWAVFVESDSCMIVDRRGKRIGSLNRVHRGSPTMGATPPEGATVLFDGTNTEQFTTARMTEDGLLMEGADTRPMFQDFDLHVEFRLPYMPNSDGQKRGNSGCYLQSRYEVQVLDSFAQVPVFNGCSSLYRFKAPDLNMCYPPLQWQTYDIRFTAPRWAADGSKIRNARITVWQNGIKTQDNVELPNKTGAGKPEEPTLLPIRFQNHSDPVRFRNMWIVDRGLIQTPFPRFATKVTAQQEQPSSKKATDKQQASGKENAQRRPPSALVAAAKKVSQAQSKAPEKPSQPKKTQADEPVQKQATDRSSDSRSKAAETGPKEQSDTSGDQSSKQASN